MRASSMACSFLASSYSEFSEMSPKSRAARMRSATSSRLTLREVLDLLLEALEALRGEDDLAIDHWIPPLQRGNAAPMRSRVPKWRASIGHA